VCECLCKSVSVCESVFVCVSVCVREREIVCECLCESVCMSVCEMFQMITDESTMILCNVKNYTPQNTNHI
jgi:hypothetical protein